MQTSSAKSALVARALQKGSIVSKLSLLIAKRLLLRNLMEGAGDVNELGIPLLQLLILLELPIRLLLLLLLLLLLPLQLPLNY